ncbi:unnamed protein product [Cylindrotheca closterium]|uniref:Uncharacterized protein n=1 Tax=Cylindrotheca closterium TaxID=2856 RepID=A0AAD2CGY6_9STRA|nr:unnamed protein product [Cylindrotheca closterium]
MEQILREHSGLDDAFGVSDYSDDESLDESIKASIERIRQEASRMDLYIALDQIDSLQRENGAVQSTLRSTEAELDTLKEKVSSLTMERDLLKVDTNNLREDMTTLVEKMFEISCVAGTSSLAGSNHPTVHNDDSLSIIIDKSPIPPDVMVLNEPCRSFESAPSQSDDQLLPRRSKVGQTNRNEKVKLLSSKYNSIARAAALSHCSTITENCQSSIVESISEYQDKKQISPDPSLHMKKSTKAHSVPVYTLRPVERKRTIFCRLLRLMSSCSRSRQVAALQDQLDQLQSMVRLSITTTEQLQMRMSQPNQNSLGDSPSELRHLKD